MWVLQEESNFKTSDFTLWRPSNEQQRIRLWTNKVRDNEGWGRWRSHGRSHGIQGNGEEISYRHEEGFNKIACQLASEGKGGGETGRAWGGGKSGKFYGKTTRFPHTTNRGLNNDRSLIKVTKREGSWEVDDDDLTSFRMVTVPCIQKCKEQLIE